MGLFFKSTGDWSSTISWLEKIKNSNAVLQPILQKYAEMGRQALASATPVRTGKTAASWTYEIQNGGGKSIITWSNTNENEGQNIALLIQYGHGLKSGGYVQGRDYINPAIQPVMDQIANSAYEEIMNI